MVQHRPCGFFTSRANHVTLKPLGKLFDDGVIHNTDEANTKEVCTHSSAAVPLDADIHIMNTGVTTQRKQSRSYTVLLYITFNLGND